MITARNIEINGVTYKATLSTNLRGFGEFLSVYEGGDKIAELEWNNGAPVALVGDDEGAFEPLPANVLPAVVAALVAKGAR